MKKKDLKQYLNKGISAPVGILIVLLVAVIAGVLVWQFWPEKGELSAPLPAPTLPINEEEAVRDVVILFGKRIKNVPQAVTASEEIIRKEIKSNYSELLSNKLYSKWMEDPREAPGRALSSPWPEKAEIISLTKESPERYKVKGYIVWMTSVTAGGSGVIFTVIKEKDEVAGTERWVIDDLERTKEGVELPCLDTDGGKNYYDKGIVTVNEIPMLTHTDSCEDNFTLIEYYCPGPGGIKFEFYNCIHGCENGACK